MIALLQRVTEANVAIDGDTVAAIGRGLLVLACVERGDGERQAERMAERLLGYRVFADADGRMNRSVGDVGGELLLVPQFTLAADTRKGMRPSFAGGPDAGTGRRLFSHLAEACERRGLAPQLGRFGADMAVSLTNDGPVTFWLKA